MRCPACNAWTEVDGHPHVQRAVSGFLTLDQLAAVGQILAGPPEHACPTCLVQAMAEAV